MARSRRAAVLSRIYTVGHSTRSPEQLLEILHDAQVATVADVRAYPASRRHPHFNRAGLSEWLQMAGLGYVDLPALGGRRRVHEDSPNDAWRQASFRAYADHMATTEFAAGLAQLEQLARQKRTAIMCAEALWWRCHRRLVSDALTARGWEVEHLGSGEPQLHELTPFAQVSDEGVLTYPQAQMALGSNNEEESWEHR